MICVREDPSHVRQGCHPEAAPGLPWLCPFPEGPCACGQGQLRASCLWQPSSSLAAFGQRGRCACSHTASPAACYLPGLGLGGRLAPRPLLRACLCSCDTLLTHSETEGTWQALRGTCQRVAVLRIRLGYPKSSCVGDVNRNKCLNGRRFFYTPRKDVY